MGTIVDVSENIESLGLTDEQEQMEESMTTRIRFYHQQLYFLLLIILFFTYFLGYSFYSLVYYISIAIYQTVKRLVKKFYEYTKSKAE